MKNVADIYPLTPVQLGMLFHTLVAPDDAIYINQYVCTLTGVVRPSDLRKAWDLVVSRHDVLRTVFLWEGVDEPLQVVRQQVQLDWQYMDWRQMATETQIVNLDRWLQQDRRKGFNLAKAPLMRVTLIRLSDNSYQLVWSSHHLIVDGWSLLLIWNELLKTYSAIDQNTSPANPVAPPFRDYIEWLQKRDRSVSKPFWQQQLKMYTGPTPVPACRVETGESNHPDYQEHSLILPFGLSNELRQLAQQQRLTIATLIQSAWAILLSHFSGEKQVTYGSVMSGRTPELSSIDQMVGLFINTLPICVPVVSDQPLISWLHDRQEQQLAIRNFESTSLADIQRWSGRSNSVPLFQTVVVVENLNTDVQVDIPFHWHDERYIIHNHYPLSIVVFPNQKLKLTLSYDANWFKVASVRRILDHLELLLTSFAEYPHTPLAELSTLR